MDRTPSEPRPAATLVVVRDGDDGSAEVLLTIRPLSLRFMGGAAVFPGGGTAPDDMDPSWEACSARSGAEAAALLDLEPGPALGAHVACIREAFEEVGLLLAEGPVERLERKDLTPERFRAACLSLGIRLRSDQLIPVGRWVTPLGSPIRFDTRFFVTRSPEGWEPEPDPSEVDGCFWISPTTALDRVAAGDLLMAPPTIEMLQRLSAHATVAEILDSIADVPLDGPGAVLSMRLSPLVSVVLAPNPGLMTGPGTNTYVVGSGPTCVIDPAVDDPAYLDAVQAAAGEVAAILVTHRHADHVGGCRALASRTSAPVRAWGRDPAGGVPVSPLQEGEELAFGAARLRALHTPGHASDHVCFYMNDVASLFAGDNILGEGTAVIAPPDGDMGDYLHTLERLRELHVERIYPGHFRPLDGGTAVIESYLAHREARRLQVVAALEGGSATPEEIVERVYADVDPQLHPVAVLQTRALLDLLFERGQVGIRGQRWFLTDVD